MAETIAKIKVRQGNLSDLPILSPGEQGYALDAKRMFVGNTRLSPIMAISGSREYNFNVDLDFMPSYNLFVSEVDLTTSDPATTLPYQYPTESLYKITDIKSYTSVSQDGRLLTLNHSKAWIYDEDLDASGTTEFSISEGLTPYKVTKQSISDTSPVELAEGSDYEVDATDTHTVRFTGYAPALDDEIVIYGEVKSGYYVNLEYNTEILTYQPDREDDVPTEVTLEAPSTTIPQLAIDQTRYNNGEIKYSIRDNINGHVRTGIVTFALMNGTARLSDNYVVCDDAHLPHEFSGTWNGDVYTFNATTTSTEEVTLTFITNLWKS